MIEFIWDILGNINITETVFQFMCINAIMGLSIYLTLYTGMFSLAQAGFMSIGAYVGVLTTQNLPSVFVAWGWATEPPTIHLWWGVLAGALAAGIIALPIGLPALRLRDIYLAIATIGFGEIIRELIKNFDNIVQFFIETFTDVERSRFTLLEGARGLKGIPKLTTTADLLIFLIVAGYLLVRLRRSRLGRAMAAIRQDERAAANMGIDVVYIKNWVFVLSAMLAGAGGALSGHLTRIITPEAFGFNTAVDILAYAVLGGTGAWFGPLIGGMTLGALPEVLRFSDQYRGVISGLVLLLVIVYLPKGIIGIPEMIQNARRRRAMSESTSLS
ncbi:MAG: branched-chain amino acid ABC transporter permease [Phototrophicaceae bacterium]|jgi:branched-chain amino acid transport system permease protein